MRWNRVELFTNFIYHNEKPDTTSQEVLDIYNQNLIDIITIKNINYDIVNHVRKIHEQKNKRVNITDDTREDFQNVRINEINQKSDVYAELQNCIYDDLEISDLLSKADNEDKKFKQLKINYQTLDLKMAIYRPKLFLFFISVTDVKIEKEFKAVHTRKRRKIHAEYVKLGNESTKLDVVMELRNYEVAMLIVPKTMLAAESLLGPFIKNLLGFRPNPKIINVISPEVL
ncbi:hypothetical protein RhiirC2_720189 [Rhizophagus irregularis]|uniref:Uncharacterized protein n=1 Tax=Rhizophagus irregularis TaxID=588596 RepID=A0A2N1MB93_9GLOM|nr:hypothetical protein RhiirC2_720189 [Rhizophagus irregularis]